nr:RHS repeat-associated core domain-containing protein [Flavobacterium soli]
MVEEAVERSNYQYKYNGKEFQDELVLGWYDYQARNYDPALGRWMNIDPLAEVSRKWSPYVYCYNNPMIFVDPDGMFATPPTDFYNLNGKHVKHIEDGKTDKKMVLTKSEKESKVQSAIDKGQVVSAFSDSESDKMSEIYNNDAENKSFTEQGFMRGTNGESEIVTGAKAGEIGSKEWASARAELSENGSTPISDVHLHPNKFDSSGNIKQFGKAMGSGADVAPANNKGYTEPSVVLGYKKETEHLSTSQIGQTPKVEIIPTAAFYDTNKGNNPIITIPFSELKETIKTINTQ